MVVKEIEVYNISKMIYALNIVDETKLSNVTYDFDYRLEKNESLRSVVFYLIVFKHLVDTNNKQVDE